MCVLNVFVVLSVCIDIRITLCCTFCVTFARISICLNVFTLFVESAYLEAHAAPVSLSSSSVLQRVLNRTKLFSRDTNVAW